jgi:hypothetical protein
MLHHGWSQPRNWILSFPSKLFFELPSIKVDLMIYRSYWSITIDRMIYRSYWSIKIDRMIYQFYWSITIDRMIYRSIDLSRSIGWSIDHPIDRDRLDDLSIDRDRLDDLSIDRDRSIGPIDHQIDCDPFIWSIDPLIDQ